MILMSELVGQMGAYPLLCEFLDRSDIYQTQEIEQLLDEISISENIFSDMVKAGLIIGAPNGFYISSSGKKVTLLLQAVNEDEDLDKVFHNLTFLYPNLRHHELITHNITDYFIDSLYARPDFLRLSICSPWIRLDDSYIDNIRSAVMRASSIYPKIKIRVITLPLDRYNNQNAAKKSLGALKQLGAEIVTNTKLHAKLYMCEPGPKGGAHFAILGSENLTGKGNIELAIKIENDNEILRKLDQYYFDIWQNSTFLQEV